MQPSAERHRPDVTELRSGGDHPCGVRDQLDAWVLGGDPCVENTRIPTSAIYVLRTERGLSAEQIADLYPGLDPDKAVDAYELETRLRGPVDLAA